MKKKGQVTEFIFYILIATIVIIIGAIGVPATVQFTEDIYTFSGDFWLQSNDTIATIENATIKADMTTLANKAIGSSATNETIIKSTFSFSWIIVLLLAFLIVFFSVQDNVTIRSFRGGII